MKLSVQNSLTALAVICIIAAVGCGQSTGVGVGKDGGPYPVPKEASPQVMQQKAAEQATIAQNRLKGAPAGSQGTAKPAGQ